MFGGRRPTAGEGSLRNRARRYGPLLLWMCFIFLASTGAFAASNTSRVIGPLLVWLFPGISEAGLLRAHLVVRKAGHFAEYAVLALLAARAFATSSRTLLSRRWRLASFALVAACALLDEFHQTFVPSRAGTASDSLIDVFGGASALAVISLLTRRRGLRGGRPDPSC